MSIKEQFVNSMESDEQLLYYNTSSINKGSSIIVKYLLKFFALFIVFLLIILVSSNSVIRLVLILLLGIFTVILVLNFYKAFTSNEKIINNEYFITNKRVALFSSKTGFRAESIFNIRFLGVIKKKNNYGDLVINFNGKNFTEISRSAMRFDYIESPYKVSEVIFGVNPNITFIS